MMSPAFAIILFTFLALIIAVGLLAVSALLGPHRRRKGKLEPYECGMPIIDDVRKPFHVQYYLVAVTFLLFDIELAFIIPWASVFKRIGPEAVLAMGIFVVLLALGLIYEWAKGSFEWD